MKGRRQVKAVVTKSERVLDRVRGRNKGNMDKEDINDQNSAEMLRIT